MTIYDAAGAETLRRRAEQLKDRRDYRRTLIQRKEEIEAKLQRTEMEISSLRNG